ncbi:MAG: hypothetical protein M3314_10185, partial [Actinomycetota bacterium]|nr:hypothetical protein [Actinomycetota bacterium]
SGTGGPSVASSSAVGGSGAVTRLTDDPLAVTGDSGEAKTQGSVTNTGNTGDASSDASSTPTASSGDSGDTGAVADLDAVVSATNTAILGQAVAGFGEGPVAESDNPVTPWDEQEFQDLLNQLLGA